MTPTKEAAMIVKKPAKTKTIKAKNKKPADWREAIRLHLASVPEIDAVFARIEDDVLHIYSVVGEFGEGYNQLTKRESKLEKSFPEIQFDFHTRAHQGRDPHKAVPGDAEQVFSR
jgi:hypothetical protein